MMFRDLELPASLALALEKNKFLQATEIQKKAFPILFQGKDLIACSQTGSGKTIAFLVPLLKRLIENPQSQALILAPTRELATQIGENLRALTSHLQEMTTVQLIGGQDIRKQFKSLQRAPRIVVATPGRLIDHIKRKTVHIHQRDFLVIDEGDRMIDMGFAPQLQQILKFLPKVRQTSFFTATLDAKVKALAAQYLHRPESLVINNSVPVAKIKQSIRQVESKDKNEFLLNEMHARKGSVIIFLRTQLRTDRLRKYLHDYGFKVDSLHGGKSQSQRTKAIQNFKSRQIQILCATDVAARGLDVPHIEHVINFDLPMQDEDYVHRIGRTARNGASGEAITFVSMGEHRAWNRLAKKYEISDCMIGMPDVQEGRPRNNGGKGGGRNFRGKRPRPQNSRGRSFKGKSRPRPS